MSGEHASLSKTPDFAGTPTALTILTERAADATVNLGIFNQFYRIAFW